MNASVRTLRIEVCLGSSCFAKGSQRLAEAAAGWSQAHPGAVQLAGHRCRGRCGEGPWVALDGSERRVAEPAVLLALLRSAAGDAP